MYYAPIVGFICRRWVIRLVCLVFFDWHHRDTVSGQKSMVFRKTCMNLLHYYSLRTTDKQIARNTHRVVDMNKHTHTHRADSMACGKLSIANQTKPFVILCMSVCFNSQQSVIWPKMWNWLMMLMFAKCVKSTSSEHEVSLTHHHIHVVAKQ